MERRYVPSEWDTQPGGSSSPQGQNDGRAAKQTVPGTKFGEHERRAKLSQAYGRQLLSVIQSSQIPHSSSTFPNLISSSPQLPPPSTGIPPPSRQIPPSSVDESKRSNPFPTEIGQKRDGRPKQEAPKPQVSSNTIPSIPVHNVSSSIPVSPGTNLNADAVRRQIMLAGINALAMSNPSLQNQLLPKLGQDNTAVVNSLQAQFLYGLNNSAVVKNPSLQPQLFLGQNNSVIANSPPLQAQFLPGKQNPGVVNNVSIQTQLLLSQNDSALVNNPLLQAQFLLGQNNTVNNLPFFGVRMENSVPDGSGILKYCAPNIDSLVFDQDAGYKFDPTTGLHYDANSGLFINLALKTFLRWDPILNTYLRVDSPCSRQASRGGPDPVVSQSPRPALSKMNVQPTGIQEAIQSLVTNVPMSLSSSLPSVQDSFMNEIWQRMRALAKEAIADSQSSHTPGQAARMKNEKLPYVRSDSENSDDQRHRGKPRPSSSDRSRSASLEARRKDSDERRTRRSRSRSYSVDSTERRKGKRQSRSHSKGAERSTHSKSPGYNRRRSRSKDSRRSRSRGRWRRGSRGRGTRSRSRRRRSVSRARRSRSRGRRSASRPWRSRSRGHRRSVSRSPVQRRSKQKRGSHSRDRRSRSRSVRRGQSRGRRSLSRGPRGSHSIRMIVSRSPGRHSDYTRSTIQDGPDRILKRKAEVRVPTSISNHADGKNKKYEGDEEPKGSNLAPAMNNEETNQNDLDNLSDFDFLKETLDDDNESVVVDEYEEALEHDESMFTDKSLDLKKAETVDLSDVLGHLFPNDGHTSSIVLVAPVPLRDDARNAKDLKNQVGDRDNVLKIQVFNKATGAPCHYMLIFFRTTEAATQWYNSNNGVVILNGYDGSRTRGYLHFAESGNWHCSKCKCGNFLMRILCLKCYQAKDNQYSPVTVAKEPTQFVGIAKLKSCFPTTDSVIDSLPSLDMFNIQNVQMITDARNLPLGLCVFELKNEEEGIRLYSFFRQQGLCSIYVLLNRKPDDSSGVENIDVNCEYNADDYVCIDDKNTLLDEKKCDVVDPLAPLFNTTPSFDKFTGSDLITTVNIAQQTPTGSRESTSAVVNDTGLSEITGLIAKSSSEETSNLPNIEISELEPDTYSKPFLLWWGQDSARYSDILNDLFLYNPWTRISPSQTIFVGPLPNSIRYGTKSSPFQEILMDKLEQENVPFSSISIHSGPLYGAPCTYGLVCFNKHQDAEAWQYKHKAGLILPRPQSIQKTAEPSSREENVFKTFVYFCKTNWACHRCRKLNFGLRTHCATCLSAKEPGPPIISFTNTPTNYVCIRKFKSWTVTEERLVAHDPFLKEHNKLFKYKLFKERSGIPVGTCILETKDTSDAQLLFNHLRVTEGKKVVSYGILPESVPMSVPPSMVSKEVLICPDHETILWTSLFEKRLNNPPSSVVMISLCPGDSELPDEARTQIRNSLQQACIATGKQSIVYSFKGHVGSPFSYSLVSFGSVDSAKTWVDMCNGTFQFNVRWPDDTTTLPNFQNCYSMKNSSSGDTTYSIKSKLYYSVSNWLCSCGAANFPLRSLCHNCFKNKDKESDYECIHDASSFVGIKLTKYRDLVDSNPVLELRKAGHKILKIAACFDPTLPRDPCGVVILETQSPELGTKLHKFLSKGISQNSIYQNYKGLMLVLGKSSGIAYLKCPKSLEPNWTFCEPHYWESYFDNELSNIIAVDKLRNCRNFAVDIPLEQYGGRIKRCRHSMGFIPDFCLIHFPTPQAAKEWHDANKGKVKNPITSALHSLHYTKNFWQCPNCSAPNFPARVLCHRCYTHRMGEFSPVRISKWPTRWVGVTKKSYQKQAVASLIKDCREEDENFQLRSVELFLDPNLREDGICIFVFEVSCPVEGSQLRNFFKKRCIQSSFFELIQQSQTLAGISTVSTVSDKLHEEVKEKTACAPESYDILNLNQSPDRGTGSSTINPIDDNWLYDSLLADSPADPETVVVQSEGLISEPKSGIYHKKLEEQGTKTASNEHAELFIACHERNNSTLLNETQGCNPELRAPEEIQLSNAVVDPARSTQHPHSYPAPAMCTSANEPCVDAEYQNDESIPMDTLEPNALMETRIIF